MRQRDLLCKIQPNMRYGVEFSPPGEEQVAFAHLPSFSVTQILSFSFTQIQTETWSLLSLFVFLCVLQPCTM